MKNRITAVFLLLSLSSSFCPALPASSLGEEIYSDLLGLQIQISGLNSILESLEQTLSESEKSIADLERIQAEKEKLLNDLQTLLDKREWILNQLSMLVEDQQTAYKKSLLKWKLTTVTLTVSSASLLCIVIYQRASK